MNSQSCLNHITSCMNSCMRSCLPQTGGVDVKALDLPLKDEDAVIVTVMAACGLSLRPLRLMDMTDRYKMDPEPLRVKEMR